MATIEMVTRSVQMLAACCRSETDEMILEVYAMALSDLSDDQLKLAVATLARTTKFMPSPAEIIEAATTSGISYEAQAALAFEELDQALGANTPSMMSPAVAAVARQIGGFQRLREIPLDDFNTWKRKDFISIYVTLAKENPGRLAAIAGPRSELSVAFASCLKRIPSKEDIALEEDENRKKIRKAIES